MVNGKYNDDPSIADGHPLWRRIPPGRWTYDHNLGRLRPTSDCFRYSPEDPETGERDPMSVILGAEIASTDDALAGHAAFKLVTFAAGRARQLELGVCRDPLPTMEAHALVFAPTKSDIPTSARRRLAEEAGWVIAPSGDEVEEAKKRTSSQ